MKQIILVSLLLCAIATKAQNNELGSWNILNIKYAHSNKYSAFAEAQIRSLKLYDHFHYHEYKAGINYHFISNTVFTLAAGNYQTYKEGGNFIVPKNNNEFRIWPQITLNQTIKKIKIEQRYRTELRFTNNGYRNRFRYRLGISYAFGKTSKNYKPFKVNVSNELFFTTKEPYFERNRINFTFSFKPSKMTIIQLGYLHQFDYKINDETGRDFIQVGLFIEFAKKSENKTKS